MVKVMEPINFRSLGGIRGWGGKTVAHGRLFRGGQLFEMPAAAKKDFCDTYGIRTIIDLRNEDSYSVEPNGEIPGVTQHIFEVMRDMDELSKNHPMRDSDAEAANNFMKEIYGEFISDPHANRCFRDIVSLVAAQETGGIYFHCYAGKDRTGVTAAILLTILGASEEDILTDYTATIEGRREENERLIAIAREEGRPEEVIGAMRVYLTVHPDYLKRTFRKAEELYGSFEGYVRQGIGVGDEIIETMRQRYLA